MKNIMLDFLKKYYFDEIEVNQTLKDKDNKYFAQFEKFDELLENGDEIQNLVLNYIDFALEVISNCPYIEIRLKNK